MEMVSNRKAAERIIIINRSLIPKKNPAPPGAMPPPPVLPAHPDKGKSKAPLSPVPESPPPSSFVPRPDSIVSFLALKLHHFIGDDKVPLSELRQVATCGSLFASLDLLEPVIPAVASWDRTAAASEFLTWDTLSRVLASVAPDGMSDVRSSSPVPGRPASPQPAQSGDPGAAPSAREPPQAPHVAPACENFLLTCPSRPYLPFLTVTSTFRSAPILSSPPAPLRRVEASLSQPSQETMLWLVNPAGFDSPAGSPIPVLSPLPGPGWHKVNDPEPTVAELHAAVSAIKSGTPSTLADFVPPPPARQATTADWKAAVSALADPSPSVVPDSQPWSDTPLVAPTPMSLASAPLTNWQPTPVVTNDAPVIPILLDVDDDLSRSLCVLQAAHPTACDDFLLAILEKEDMNTAAALGWLSTIQEISALTLAMKEAFPSAPELRISRLVQSFGGDMSSVWAVLSKSYDSPWTSAFSASAVQSKVSRSAMLPGSDEEGSNVLVASDSLKNFQQDWWLTYVTSRQYRLGPCSDLVPMWEPFCHVAAVSLPISPCFIMYISSLGNRNDDRPSFSEAVMFIRALPHFKDASDRLNELHELALYAIPLLLEDGLATPFAALWYALGALSADDWLFKKFPKAHIRVCKLSNRALRDHLAIPEKPTTAATIIIESSDEELTTEGALDLAMGPARSPPADVEMSSARPRWLAKDSSSLCYRTTKSGYDLMHTG